MKDQEFEDKYLSQLNEQQRVAVQSVDGPVLLLAVPGSGKTTVLITRLGYISNIWRISISVTARLNC